MRKFSGARIPPGGQLSEEDNKGTWRDAHAIVSIPEGEQTLKKEGEATKSEAKEAVLVAQTTGAAGQQAAAGEAKGEGEGEATKSETKQEGLAEQ
ncbi:unnamed protein product, partial [Anisakis simplex]|uniref:Uncharacterized protein n=1 Tax=Anisakis simplex TaxID=6269 RepID=A0A0M3JN05_ANISI